jgi:SAM-dependent methyltransferase
VSRAGYKYVAAVTGAAVHTEIDSAPAELAEGIGPPPDLAQPWIRELHDVYRRFLDPETRTLGIGSGYGEHELLLWQAGYDIVASDVLDKPLQHTASSTPGFQWQIVDIFDEQDEQWTQILVCGLDCYFDDEQTKLLFARLAALLAPGGRLVFTLRYRDTIATRIIDALSVAIAVARRLKWRAQRRNLMLRRKQHGYRRSEREIVEFAERVGLRVFDVEHAAYAMELSRLGVVPNAERAYEIARRLDQRVGWFASATVFHFSRPDA